MKFIAVAILFAVALTLATAEDDKKKCYNADDCKPDECCLRRSKSIFDFKRGLCTKLAEKGDRCSYEEMLFLGRHIEFCPCQEGLDCEPTEVNENWWGTSWVNEKCTDGTTDEPEVRTDDPETDAPEETTDAPEEVTVESQETTEE